MIKILKPFAVFVAIGLAIPGNAGAQQASMLAQTVLVRKNTALKFALLGPIDPATAKVGDDVPLRPALPLVVDGINLLPTDDVVHGRVTKVKDFNKKCGYREVDFDLNQISFADSTVAKSKVFFVSSRPDVNVDMDHGSGSHAAPSDIPGAAAETLLMLPLIVFLPFAHPCWPSSVYARPANSTVGAVIAKDHRVRY